MDGKVLSVDEVKALAKLPSKEELYAKMLGCINSPATGIVGGINGVMSALVRAIDQVRQQKTAQNTLVILLKKGENKNVSTRNFRIY